MSEFPPSSQVNAIEKEKVRDKTNARQAQGNLGTLGRGGDLNNDPVSLRVVPSTAGGDKAIDGRGGTTLPRYRSFRR